jgi:hypothetical protein
MELSSGSIFRILGTPQGATAIIVIVVAERQISVSLLLRAILSAM